jgi:sugar phosphate isomerase/epimerase
VYVACSTQCFARLPLERALRLINELEFSKVEIAIHEQGTHVRPSEVARDIPLAAQRIRIGPSLSPAAFCVDIETPTHQEYVSQLKAICKLARMSAVSVLTIPAASNRSGVDAEIVRLRELVHLVEAEGLVLTVTTRTGTLTETPALAVELCERVPGLGLTLDPSHFINGPHQGAPFDEVYPYVRHVHLRDSGRRRGSFRCASARARSSTAGSSRSSSAAATTACSPWPSTTSPTRRTRWRRRFASSSICWRVWCDGQWSVEGSCSSALN